MLWSQFPSPLSSPYQKQRSRNFNWFLIPTLCTWPNHNWVLDSYTSFTLINSCFLGLAIACIWSQIPCYLMVDHSNLTHSPVTAPIFGKSIYIFMQTRIHFFIMLLNLDLIMHFFFFKLANLFCKIYIYIYILNFLTPMNRLLSPIIFI